MSAKLMVLQGFDISWLLPILLALAFSNSISLGDNVTDSVSLLSFKSQIREDPLNILSSWNDSIHFCYWSGITCGRRHQRVTVLDLEGSLLKGRLSAYIGNLSFLRILNLQNNSFSHEIPEEIGRLFRLQVLALRNNSLSGNIPPNISSCFNLQVLDLHRNNITGEIPKDLDSLTKLRIFDLFTNNFVGEIPASMGNLSSLRWFSVAENRLHGSIPDSFGKLKRLWHLGFTSNYLSGRVPPSIYNLSLMEEFCVLGNQLEGNLPLDLGHTSFPRLRVFLAEYNQFSGSIPVAISNASNLFDFQIMVNKFTGKVPSFAGLSNLRSIGLSENNLGHDEDDDLDFLSSLVNCTAFEILEMEENNFGGVLPEYMSNFSSKFIFITLGRTYIRGSLPSEIGNLVNLESIYSEENQIGGHIPSSICRLKNLHELDLSGDKISGTIPSCIGNLTSLSVLYLMGNNLQGYIPSSLGECRNLQELRLSHNNLSGPIPRNVLSLSSFIFLDLPGNCLTGFIPSEVGRLVNLNGLDISENKLNGEIPETIGGCSSLIYLNFKGNILQGTIPQSLSSLKGIEKIDLSQNNLSGKIPKYLANFKFLHYLNLSSNNFEGEVPKNGVFSNASALSILGNTKLCGGIPQLDLPRCAFDLHKKHRALSSKLKFIISAACGLVLFILVLLLLLLFRLRKRPGSKSITGSSSFGVSFLKISYGDLYKATNGFSLENLIGAGSFGSVYKGILNQEESAVAVKVLHLETSRAPKSFIAECKALKNMKHRNLVKLITACSSIDFQANEFKALVYEFMVNRSLEEWLHPSDQSVDMEQNHMPLDLLQRVNIAIDVGSAIDYLHNQCHVPIVHCDLKPSNILLDGDMTARVADFGLARFLPDASHPFSSDNQISSIGIRGSIGYAAPEYGMGNEVSTFGDVYSYGTLLLEMFTGKRPTDILFKDGFSLRKFALMASPDGVEEILDPMLLQRDEGNININGNLDMTHPPQYQKVQECLISIFKIGVACAAEVPRERMEITDVLAELCHIKDKLVGRRISRNNHRNQEA